MSSSINIEPPPQDRSRPVADHDHQFLATAIDSIAGKERTAVITLPAPVAPVETLLEVSVPGSELGFCWSPNEGTAYAGLGATHRIEATSDDRFSVLADQCDSIWQRLNRVTAPGLEPVEPRLFGGLSFAAEKRVDPIWGALGAASFLLPRWCYARSEKTAWLSLAVRGEDIVSPNDRDLLLSELDSIRERLQQNDQATTTPPPAILEVQQLSREAWSERIEAIRQAIDRGDLEKVVAARVAKVKLADTLHDVDLFRRLSTAAPNIRFAFRRGATTFLGSTPERLIEKRGDHIRSEALAGSVGKGRGAELLASNKDHHEQSFVVRDIVTALEKHCSRLTYPDAPELRRLTHLLHLCTPIEGQLERPTHILDLLEQLHPTSAVGGVPSARAIALIRKQEPEGRGWYAGPVGWFDRNGDGEFAVALRSGLLSGRTVQIFAGAGIVQGSDPDKEYDETALKQRSFLAALGASV